MEETALEAFYKFNDQDPALVWKAIYVAHVARKSGISATPEIVKSVISSDNSWKKSSGHAFEKIAKELFGKIDPNSQIEFLLQKDLSILLSNGEVSNAKRDLDNITSWVGSSAFDLYAILNEESKKFVFGCIQAKTSIRDRVTRDREPSTIAMENNFWSIAVVLDGEYLKNLKFQAMVDGGSSDFTKNGWHGLYAMSSPVETNRILRLGSDFSLLYKHALLASKMWRNQRQWLDHSWHHNLE